MLALSGRAYIEDVRGEHDRAIADYEQAVRVNPNVPYIQLALGSDYFAAGDRERAVATLGTAIHGAPDQEAAYVMRGIANLYGGGPLDQARADFEKAATLAPKDAYAALLVEVTGRRSHAPSRLSDAAKQLDMSAWPAPIVRLFLGQSAPAATIAAAHDPDPAKNLGRLCEANFYVGEFYAVQGSPDTALPFYRLAAHDCPGYGQRATANAALKSLGARP